MMPLTFSGLQDERDTFPSGVVDPESCGSECWANRVTRDSVIVEVTWLAVGRDILTEQSIVPLNWRN
jgi:hypothetical protein